MASFFELCKNNRIYFNNLDTKRRKSVTGNKKYSNIGNETAAKKVISVQQKW